MIIDIYLLKPDMIFRSVEYMSNSELLQQSNIFDCFSVGKKQSWKYTVVAGQSILYLIRNFLLGLY